MTTLLGSFPPAETWFDCWLEKHCQWNRGRGWDQFLAAGSDVFRPWIAAFNRLQVAEADAEAASCQLASESQLFPEEHLPRLLELVAAIVADRQPTSIKSSVKQAHEAEEKRVAEEDALVLATWDQASSPTQQAYLDRVRQACPHFARWAGIVRSLAQAVYAADHAVLVAIEAGNEPPPDGQSTLDLMRPPERSARSLADSFAIPFRPVPVAITAAQEQALEAKAAESKRSQLDRLRAMTQPQPIAS